MSEVINDDSFKTAAEVGRYLNKESGDLLSKYTESERWAFVDGAKWMFEAFIKTKAEMKDTISKLRAKLLETENELTDYKMTFESSTYTTSKKAKKRKPAPVEDDEDENDEFYTDNESRFDERMSFEVIDKESEYLS